MHLRTRACVGEEEAPRHPLDFVELTNANFSSFVHTPDTDVVSDERERPDLRPPRHTDTCEGVHEAHVTHLVYFFHFSMVCVSASEHVFAPRLCFLSAMCVM